MKTLLDTFRETKGMDKNAKVDAIDRRSVICDAYKLLSPEVKAEYKTKADTLRKSAKTNKALEGAARIE